MGRAPWAILDFPGPDGQPRREVFRDPTAVITAHRLGEVAGCLAEAERLAKAGQTVVGFVAYDAAPAFEPAFEVRRGYTGPLVWFGAFSSVIPSEARDQLPGEEPIPRLARDDQGARFDDGWTAQFDPTEYRRKVVEIIAGIERGDFYQVNLTDRFTASLPDPLGVYERVRQAQSAGYAAYVDAGDMVVASVSPELFMRRTGDILESRPMKGTSARGRWTAEDDALADRLTGSEKERAENVMIVDLIRNDMGRIAVPGTVEVPSMFTVERYPTLLQMTSCVKSQVAGTTALSDCFLALFPCGSVTGAPKIAASKSIADLESTPRGVYCGAVGVVRPGGDFTFNVAIRTIVAEPGKPAIYGAGGGITADSDPARELEELRTKAAVLTALPRQFDLIETMALANGAAIRQSRHLTRLSGSARYFGFKDWETAVDQIRTRIGQEERARPDGYFRVRVVLSPDGSHSLTVDPYRLPEGPRQVGLCLTPIDSRDPLYYHKTSDRGRYTDRLELLEGVDDALLMNERGELTETTIGNIVLKLDGRLVTPPLNCGLLPGVYRQELLDERQIAEQVVTLVDLKRCTALWMINSLRGWVECEPV